MKKIIKIQFFVLLVGTVFAWTNFSQELFAWLRNEACETGCSVTGEVLNPFFTACFYGAIFFSIAWILSIMLMIGARDKKKKGDKKVESANSSEEAGQASDQESTKEDKTNKENN